MKDQWWETVGCLSFVILFVVIFVVPFLGTLYACFLRQFNSKKGGGGGENDET